MWMTAYAVESTQQMEINALSAEGPLGHSLIMCLLRYMVYFSLHSLILILAVTSLIAGVGFFIFFLWQDSLVQWCVSLLPISAGERHLIT